MKNSNLYRIHPEEKILQAVQEIDFADFNFKDREISPNDEEYYPVGTLLQPE